MVVFVAAFVVTLLLALVLALATVPVLARVASIAVYSLTPAIALGGDDEATGK